MQVKIFSIHHLHTAAYPLWIAAIKQKNEYQKRKYTFLYLSLRTLKHTLNILSFTLNPRAMEIPRQKHSIVFRYLKKQIQTSLL